MRTLLLVTSFILVSSIAIGQYSYSTKNKKAIASYEEALQYFNRQDLFSAAQLMKKAIKYDDDFTEAHIVLAEIYIESGDRKKAISSYEKVIEIDPDFFPGLYFSLAQLEMMESDFESAKKHLEKYLTFNNIKPISVSQAERKLKSCEFAIEAIKNPVPFNPINLGDSINTAYDEYWPSLTADEQTLIITRLVPKSEEEKSQMQYPGGNRNMTLSSNFQEDFYISVKENNIWTNAENAGKPLNSKGNEGAQTLLVNGQAMYFTACNRPDGKGRCDIYFSELEDNQWTEPVNISSPVNTTYWEAQPSIAPDGKTLYFVSNRSGGNGQKDIWVSYKLADGNWTKPENLGEAINSPGEEQSPFIHPDNKTLYFASNGLTGMGGFDLFKTTRKDDGSWTEPVNLGYPINTTFDEIGLMVNAKGDKAYFSSDRLSRRGRDIFQFELYQEARPNPVSYIKGKVFDADSKKNLRARFELINLETNEVVIQSESNSSTGEYLVSIPTNNDYAFNVSKDGYLFYSDNFELKGVYQIDDPYLKDIALNPIKSGEKIILRNVFYATDSYELEEKSKTELSRLLEFLNNNPRLKIEISGHTDNVGASDYNAKLSENRAKSVYNYLIKNQVNKDRLTYKGYGETQPISSNDTESGRAENRRTEIKILSSN